jgi:hypothetical protein
MQRLTTISALPLRSRRWTRAQPATVAAVLFTIQPLQSALGRDCMLALWPLESEVPPVMALNRPST